MKHMDGGQIDGQVGNNTMSIIVYLSSGDKSALFMILKNADDKELLCLCFYSLIVVTLQEITAAPVLMARAPARRASPKRRRSPSPRRRRSPSPRGGRRGSRSPRRRRSPSPRRRSPARRRSRSGKGRSRSPARRRSPPRRRSRTPARRRKDSTSSSSSDSSR